MSDLSDKSDKYVFARGNAGLGKTHRLIRHSNRQLSLFTALSCPKKGHDSYT